MPVYILQVGECGAVKIGYSGARVLATRLGSIQSCNHERLHLIRLLDGGRKLEAALHAQFSSLRIRGEWFAYDDAMMRDVSAADLPLISAPSVVGNDWTPERRALAAEYGRKSHATAKQAAA